MEYESHSRPWWEYLKFYVMFIAMVGSGLWLIYTWKSGLEPTSTNDDLDINLSVSDNSQKDNPKAVLIPFLQSIESGDISAALQYVSLRDRAAISGKLISLKSAELRDFESKFRLAMAEKGSFNDDSEYVISGSMQITISKDDGSWKISKLKY